jgi:pilus assembly protein Flp/PilA
MEVSGIIVGFIRDEGAATAIEYSLMAAGIAIAVAATVMSLGSTVKSTFYDRLMALM